MRFKTIFLLLTAILISFFLTAASLMAAWQIETVDSIGDVGRYCSLTVDASGNPHISYYDGTNKHLKYAYKDTAGWHIETADADGKAGEYSSIALDANGNPHISYYASYNSSNQYIADLKYAYKDGSGWHTETVDTYGFTGRYTSIAIDSNGYPHISYFLETYPNYYFASILMYAYKDSAGWHTGSVTGGNALNMSSIKLDSNDRAHIIYPIFQDVSYQCSGSGCYGGPPQNYDSMISLNYQYFPGAAIYCGQTAAAGGYGDYLYSIGMSPALSIDSANNLHISALDRYVTCDGYPWWDMFCDEFGCQPRNCMDNISTQETSRLTYTFFQNSGSTVGSNTCSSGTWNTETIETVDTPWYDNYTSIAVDPNGNPHISYFGAYLKHAYKNSAGWNTEIVDNVGYQYAFSSIAIDAAGTIHIAYYDSANMDLKYAYYSESIIPSSTTTTTIDLVTTTTSVIPPSSTTTVPSTVIELISFTAVAKNGKVILNWSTGTEIDTVGFNLYRAQVENGKYMKINSAFIQAQGSVTTGAAYTFTDSTVTNAKTYFYKLEDIDRSDISTLHGPASATPRLIYAIGR